MSGRGIILAAPASGTGKTLLALGLLRHLRRRGLKVAAAKAGPDYIDPAFHAAAIGAPSITLDPWAMRGETLGRLVGELEARSEIVLCEGAMGLYDGTGREGETGSTAALAHLVGWPVVLIVDARGAGASVAALVRGFLAHDPILEFAGVLFNRVRSPRHGRLVCEATARHLPHLGILGAVAEDPALVIPSRHLGLVAAGELAGREALIDRAADAVARSIAVDRLLDAARSSRLSAEAGDAPLAPLGGHIAVARDDAFSFVYPQVLDGWRREGAALSFFSPLAGEAPDGRAEAIYLPGGYPELRGGKIAAAEDFLSGLRRAAAAGTPIYGECGGYMVLGECLVDADGRAHRMAGLLPLVTSFAKRELALGYRAARLLERGPLGPAGARFRAHEFHYAVPLGEEGEPLFEGSDAEGRLLGRFGSRRGSACGSFLHLIDRCN